MDAISTQKHVPGSSAQALGESDERFRAVVETASDAIILADSQGTITSWNAAAQCLFGYAAEEVVGRSLTCLMPARYREAHAKGVERVRTSGHSRLAGKPVELQGLKKDGSEFPMELSLGTWKTSQGSFFSGIIRDITERKRVEVALRESQERFYQLAENIREVFWMTDPGKNQMIYVSPGYEDIWGRPCESLEASPRSWLEAIHPDDRDRVLQAALTKQIMGAYDEEYRIVRPDGSTRWIWDRAFPICNASGEVYRIAGIAEDITGRKRVEDELRASEERLELAVRGSSDGLWDGRPLPGEPWSSPRTPVWYSPRFKAMLGFEEPEFDNVLGSWSALLHPGDKDRVFAALSAHIERKEPYDVEYRLRTKQGEYRWFRARGQAIWDETGHLLRMAGSLQCVTDRKRVEAFHRTQVAVSMVLASCDSLGQAAPQLLQAVCDITGWEFGLIWLVDRDAAVLRCEALWHQPTVPGSKFTTLKKHPAFASGVGLPGRIWAGGEAAWIPDVLADSNFPRARAAADAGLHGAFGVPIRSGRRIMGVIEFFSREIRQPDTTLLQMMADIGIKVGQFVERKKDTERLRKINECLLSFGKDAHENINRLTVLCGELLGGAWAVYSCVEGDSLHAIGRWRTPPDFQPVYKADGHLCAEVIRQGRDDLMVVRHLPATSYAQTDPYVLAGRLQTYLGHAVRCNGRYIGSLCVVYQQDLLPREGDRRLMGIIASAIGVEEERKQAERALQQAYDETEKILASVPGAILVAGDDLRVVYANALAGQYFGEGRTDMIGASMNDVLPEDVAQRSWVFMKRTPQAAENGYWHQDREFERQGKVYRYRLFSLAIRGSERPQSGLVIWDITDQKRLGEQLIQAEKLASLGTLVSGMAHEVNNPAQGILGMAQIILEETDPETIKEYAQDIVGYTKHIATVVRDFATYARRSDRDGESSLNLGERMADAVKLVRRCASFGTVEVTTDFQPVPPVQARQTEIDQVFVNLIGNAVQAMNGKGRLTLATALRGGLITASVSDTGSGIPKEHLGKIFDPFFTTKAPGKGTGLGLYIVHKIVTKHRGQIQIESEVGRGTTFTVAFPTGHISPEEVSHDTAHA